MDVFERNSQALTQCYFCGEELTPSQLELHVKHCGLVLEPCPDNCGLYVQRQYKSHHSNWCKKEPHQKSMENDLKTLRSEVETLRTNLEVEFNTRHRQQAEWTHQLTRFNQRFQKLEDLNNKVIKALMSFKKLISEEREARIKDFNDMKTNLVDVCKLAAQLKFSITQTQIDISEMKNNYNLPEKDSKFYEHFEAWKSRQEIIVASLKLKVDKELNEEIYNLHKANITRSKSVSDLLDLNEIIIDEQDKYAEQMKAWQQEIERFKTFLGEENIMISGVWRDQLEEIKRLKNNIEKYEDTIKQMQKDQTVLKDRVDKILVKPETEQTLEGKENIEEVVNNLLDEGVFIRKRIEDLEKTLKSNKPIQDSKTKMNNVFAKDQEEIKSRLNEVESFLQGYTVTLKLPKTGSEKNSDEEKTEIVYFREENNRAEQRLIRPDREMVADKRKATNIPGKKFDNLEEKIHNTETVADKRMATSIQRREFENLEEKIPNTETVAGKRKATSIPRKEFEDLEEKIPTKAVADKRKATNIPKKEFENLEKLKPSTSVSTFESGRVTWAISSFAQNMKLAKENNEELKGPIFYNSEFGYKFQLRAYLNGVGQWKGRHLIVSLHVLESEWDALLKWPCRIHVVICLVDQVAILRKAKDIVKSFTSSPITRHSDYKCLQMFIPHRTLSEHCYIMEDTVILRVKLKVVSV